MNRRNQQPDWNINNPYSYMCQSSTQPLYLAPITMSFTAPITVSLTASLSMVPYPMAPYSIPNPIPYPMPYQTSHVTPFNASNPTPYQMVLFQTPSQYEPFAIHRPPKRRRSISNKQRRKIRNDIENLRKRSKLIHCQIIQE